VELLGEVEDVLAVEVDAVVDLDALADLGSESRHGLDLQLLLPDQGEVDLEDD
jgi:hypothetical protein